MGVVKAEELGAASDDDAGFWRRRYSLVQNKCNECIRFGVVIGMRRTDFCPYEWTLSILRMHQRWGAQKWFDVSLLIQGRSIYVSSFFADSVWTSSNEDVRGGGAYCAVTNLHCLILLQPFLSKRIVMLRRGQEQI